LSAALTESNRFLLVQRQSPEEIAKQKEAPLPQEQPGASLIITVTVSEFEPQPSGGKAGIGGGGGGGSGLLGGLLGAPLNKAYLALEVRIADTASSKVLALSRIQGQAAEISAGAAGLSLGKGLSAYANTPMAKAIGICVTEAVRYISQAIPPDYYKY
jgi:curli biogenesis system outer membrane secretion channel CsgG